MTALLILGRVARVARTTEQRRLDGLAATTDDDVLASEPETGPSLLGLSQVKSIPVIVDSVRQPVMAVVSMSIEVPSATRSTAAAVGST